MNRTEVETFILENFAGIEQDYPWEDTPDACIFRHSDNRKWFALIMNINYTTLHIDKPGKTDFLNLKSDPALIEELVHRPGILPAYHMNKTHWLTILLDQTLPAEEVKNLIALSYELTSKKSKTHKNP